MRTALLMALMTAILSGMGDYFGGLEGFTTMFVISIGMNLLTYWNCDKIVLAQCNAIQVDEESAPGLYGTVKKLAARAGLPMPRVYIVNDETPNAFATGRNPEHAVVCVNKGLSKILTQEELEGVLAHELTHIKNRDILISSIAAVMAGMISMVARWGMFFGGGRDENGNSRNPIVGILVMVLAPIAAALIQMAISRSREYKADEGGGEISGNPNALANALLRIEDYAKKNVPEQYVSETSAHMYIINPFCGVNMSNLFSTHPATAERVKLLREQAQRMGLVKA